MFRELSPHSRLYVGPSPPRGTKRRPVKVTTEGTDNIVEMSMGNNGSGPDVDGAVEYNTFDKHTYRLWTSSLLLGAKFTKHAKRRSQRWIPDEMINQSKNLLFSG